MEVRERNFHYKELAEMKKEEQSQYDNSVKNSPRITPPTVPNMKPSNIKVPKYY